MNKRPKDILAYFNHYILWCLIHAANIRHTINALQNRKATKRGYFEGFFSTLHTKSLPNRPFDWIWCEVPSFRGERGWRTHQHPPAPISAHRARQHPTQNQCTLKPEEPVCCINSTNQNYGFGMLRRLDFAISTMWPTPPPKTVRVAAREKPINISIVMFGGIDKALGSVMMSIRTGPS
ncbi:hypothetical protein FRC0466_01870 [Corynebacterium diphtheriae]|nr:hypothetical protein FRC0419_01861 [Corynebacterium diphtheriae]CAB0966950.1 hypothetical protein FRC0466_01870 [Corynebacterium diphtheriae]